LRKLTAKHIRARLIGEVIRDLGGGRLSKESCINYDVGVDRLAKPGERVENGGVLCRVHTTDRIKAGVASRQLESAFTISNQRPPAIRLVAGILP
jgi:thymidine phosphorylase